MPVNKIVNISTDHEDGRWCVVGNVKNHIPYGHGGLEIRNGTRQFRGGAKVKIVGSFPGSCDGLVAIGQNKHTGKYIRTIIRVTAVENLRVKLMYGMAEVALYKLPPPVGAVMIKRKEDAEYLERIIPEWSALWE